MVSTCGEMSADSSWFRKSRRLDVVFCPFNGLFYRLSHRQNPQGEVMSFNVQNEKKIMLCNSRVARGMRLFVDVFVSARLKNPL